MSNHAHYYVACDKCGVQSDGLADSSAREARSQAKANDWKLGKQKDFCKACADEMALVIRAAKAGEFKVTEHK